MLSVKEVCLIVGKECGLDLFYEPHSSAHYDSIFSLAKIIDLEACVCLIRVKNTKILIDTFKNNLPDIAIELADPDSFRQLRDIFHSL